MRNLKRFLAVLVVVVMVVSTMVPSAFAAGSFSYTSQAQTLNDLGLYKGISTTTFDPDLGTALDRQTGVVMLLRIFGLEASANALTDAEVASTLAKFTDAASIESWAKKAAAYAVKNGLVYGVTATEFGPSVNLNGKMYCTLILRQLGFTADFDNAAAQLADKGGLSVLEAVKFNSKDLVKDDLVGISYGSLKAKYSDGKTVIAKLVDGKVVTEDKAAAAGLVTKVVVSSIAAIADVTVKVGATPTLPATVSATYSDGTKKDLAVTWPAVDTTAAGDKTVEGTVADTALKATVKVKVEAVAFDVASAKSLNLREVEVTFTKAVPDEDEAEEEDNYTIEDGDYVVEEATLSDDSKTVLLLIESDDLDYNYDELELVIDEKVGFSEDETVDVKFTDTAVPTLVKVTPTGPELIKLTFSEPLDESVTSDDFINSLELDSGSVALSDEDFEYDGRDVTVNCGELSEGSHSLKVKVASDNEIKDAAGYKVPSGTVSFTYTPDTSALTATISKATETYVDILFNKDIDTDTFVGNANVQVYHSYKRADYQSDIPYVRKAANKVRANFSANPLPPGTPTIYLKYADSDEQNIEDAYGNEFPATTFTATVAADTTKPSVKSVEVYEDTTDQLKVTFSEDVTDTGSGSALSTANYTLLDDEDEEIDITDADFEEDAEDIVILTLGDDIDGGKYTLLVEGIKDQSVAANKMSDATIEFTVVDNLAPTVVDYDDEDDDIDAPMLSTKKVKITFSEPMDVTSITTRTAFKYLDGATWKVLPTGTKLTAVDSNEAVIIEFEDEIDEDNDIRVGVVKDATGNYIDTLQTEINNIGQQYVKLKKAEVTSKNTIKLTFEDNIISGVKTSDFVYSTDEDTWYTIKKVATAISGTDSSITLTIDGEFTDTALVTQVVYVKTTTAAKIEADLEADSSPTGSAKNAYGQKIKFDSTLAKDKFAPKIAIDEDEEDLAFTADWDENGSIDYVVITFTEELYTASVQEEDFEVDGYDVESVTIIDGTTVWIELDEKDIEDTDEDIEVKLVGSIEDSARNKVTNLETEATFNEDLNEDDLGEDYLD